MKIEPCLPRSSPQIKVVPIARLRPWRAPDAAQRAALAAWCAADPGPAPGKLGMGSRLCGAAWPDDASHRRENAAPRPGHVDRSPVLTIFWHCGFRHFSSRTGLGASARQPTVNGFGRRSGSKGSGNADSQPKFWNSGWSGQCRPRPCDSGCVPAHPAYRRAASYLPLRAGWAVCAWALRGCLRSPDPSARKQQRTTDKEFSK
jgi:hypothetical protein